MPPVPCVVVVSWIHSVSVVPIHFASVKVYDFERTKPRTCRHVEAANGSEARSFLGGRKLRATDMQNFEGRHLGTSANLPNLG